MTPREALQKINQAEARLGAGTKLRSGATLRTASEAELRALLADAKERLTRARREAEDAQRFRPAYAKGPTRTERGAQAILAEEQLRNDAIRSSLLLLINGIDRSPR